VVNPSTTTWRKTVETQIVSVTIYADQALVTRKGFVVLDGQENELVVTPLPVTLETESIRVGGAGKVAVKLLGASCNQFFSREPVAERVGQLTKLTQQLEAEWRNLQAQIDGLGLQSRFIQGLGEKTEQQIAISLARKSANLSETLDLVNFLGSQYSEYAIASFDCKNQQQEVEKQLQVLRQELQNIETPHPQESLSLAVAVEAEGAGEFQLEVSYMVNRASWTPLYDVRVSNTSNIVNFGYLAEISQSTGEDWLGVALTLSTAKPGVGTLPPKLEPWYVDVPTTPPPNYMMRQRVRLTASSEEENDELGEVEENIIEAETVAAKLSTEGSAVTFKLGATANIPSDGTPHKTTIFNDDYSCSFEFVAMPRLVSFAYLQAKIKNHVNGATLLPGKANIFRDRLFVGTTQIENILPGQEFKVNLGIDESLKIERELVERQVEKKLIGNNRKVTYGYKLVITNLRDQDVDLKLTEQLPVSRNEQIKIRLNRSNPQIQLGEMGILEWEMTLLSLERREIYYQFTVEYPPELTLVGLNI
jgi:uncharacterized protein (TIGR02231 family)